MTFMISSGNIQMQI